MASVLRGTFAQDDAITIDRLLPELSLGLPIDQIFGSVESDAMLQRMADEDKIMLIDGTVVRPLSLSLVDENMY